ncbi:MAG: glycerophosphodiester phosphodiesterase [Flavobacteriaceae bacterium]|nr:MAG: glycerophosphodiester phosphodiesterase [Flavobacteriaceae bacterium]
MIGHRGASGILPEHTKEGFALALEMGVDALEVDLAMCKDGALILRHDLYLSNSTNIASFPKFKDRKTIRTLQGKPVSDWFICDFTLEELKELRVKQVFEDRPQEHNYKYSLTTLSELIDQIKAYPKTKPIQLFLEIKNASFHHRNNLNIEDQTLKVLNKHGWNNAESPVYIESFEVSNLKKIRTESKVKLVQLIDADLLNHKGELVYDNQFGAPDDFGKYNDARNYGDLISNKGLDEIKTYAQAIGVWKPYIVSYNGEERTNLVATNLIERAHQRNLQVFAYSFRNEWYRLPLEYKNDPINEYLHFFNLGIDGVFTDFPDTAQQALSKFEESIKEEESFFYQLKKRFGF